MLSAMHTCDTTKTMFACSVSIDTAQAYVLSVRFLACKEGLTGLG